MLSLQQQKQLLRKEFEHERHEFELHTEAAGLGRKVKRGDCWFPVSVGRSYYNSLDRLVVEVTRSTDTDVDHNFEHGRPVVFFERTPDGQLHYLHFPATVSYAEASRMVVSLPSPEALTAVQSLGETGLLMGFDKTTYDLMFSALDAAIGAKGNRLAQLRDLTHGGVKPAFGHPGAISLPWLNRSQEQAVNDIIAARDFLIVHGPPGTGKTTTLVEAVIEVLRREPQVMVCAQSNTAVDWITGQLADRGVSVLRIGNPVRVTDRMLSYTYERRFESHPDYPTLWAVRRTLRQLLSTPRRSRTESFHQKVARLRERADVLELAIRTALFDECRVVACTLAGSANAVLGRLHFHTLFIDEAAQALEAACWIALQRCDRFILAGDHCQLPPTVKSGAAKHGGLDKTLMEELAHSRPEAVRLLTVQYRMREELMHFSSEWFYHGQLQAAPEVRHRSLLDDTDHPLLWIDTAGAEAELSADKAGTDAPAPAFREQFVGSTYGRINRAEAELTLATLRHYAAQASRHRLLEERIDFGIISPYRAQVQLLRHLLKHDDYLRPLRHAITINTVDAFQGQERDVIIVSLVRANEAGDIGFLRDLRRMNVAITRARLKLILLGDTSTLCRHTFYKRLFERCRRVTPAQMATTLQPDTTAAH